MAQVQLQHAQMIVDLSQELGVLKDHQANSTQSHQPTY